MTHYLKIALLLAIVVCPVTGVSQSDSFFLKADADTLVTIRRPVPGKFVRGLDKVANSRYFKMAYIGMPLVVSGFIVKSENDHFHDLRNQYAPLFRNRLDDYLQYMPAVAMVGLKAAGVKGRSSWGRMLTSDAISVGLMAVAVNSLKSTTHVMRPDGSNDHAFPSGHTAVAFMTATMLHKEYGMTRSPWYSVGGYTVATATAVMRQLNNKHWMSDVLTGAGIGILSVEFGYFLTDLIFKEKGITHDYLDAGEFVRSRRPSFLGIYGGLTMMSGQLPLSDRLYLHYSTGTSVGTEGAWFISPYVGFGGLLTVSGTPVILDNNRYFDSTVASEGLAETLQQASMGFYSARAGAYFSYPVSGHWLLGSKLLPGVSWIQQDDIESVYTQPDGTELSRKPIVEMSSAKGFGLSTGLSVTYLPSYNLGARLFADYNLITAKRLYHTDEMSIDRSGISVSKPLHQFVLGASVNIQF